MILTSYDCMASLGRHSQMQDEEPAAPNRQPDRNPAPEASAAGAAPLSVASDTSKQKSVVELVLDQDFGIVVGKRRCSGARCLHFCEEES